MSPILGLGVDLSDSIKARGHHARSKRLDG